VARGYPDFFGYSVFPFWGVHQIQGMLWGVVGVGLNQDIFLLSLKGVVRGGSFTLDLPDDPSNIGITLTIDGNVFGAFFLDTLLRYNFLSRDTSVFYLLHYDSDAQKYTIVLTPDISFGTEYRVNVLNAGAVNVNVFGSVIYSWIT